MHLLTCMDTQLLAAEGPSSVTATCELEHGTSGWGPQKELYSAVFVCCFTSVFSIKIFTRHWQPARALGVHAFGTSVVLGFVVLR